MLVYNNFPEPLTFYTQKISNRSVHVLSVVSSTRTPYERYPLSSTQRSWAVVERGLAGWDLPVIAHVIMDVVGFHFL